jgi:hypothetical protein
LDSDDALLPYEKKSLYRRYMKKNSYSVSFQFVKRKTAHGEEFNNLEQLPSDFFSSIASGYKDDPSRKAAYSFPRGNED